jgi:outer membrane protein assembly factor BamB
MAKNKLATAIAFFLVSTFTLALVALPTVNAHDPPWQLPTFAHIFATIDPIGVGQSEYIYCFLTPTYDSTAMVNDYRFHNYVLTITAPDGKVTTKTWETVWDTTSNQGYRFTPDQTGVYTLNFSFAGQNINDYSHNPNSDYVNDSYLSSSAVTTITVQEEQIFEYPGSYPLPTMFWTRPIYGENTGWWTISSNWLGSGVPGYGASTGPNQRQFPGDAIGSQTAHIMWTKEVQPGGVVGGNNFEIQGNTYFEGTAYSQRFTNPIIVYGRIFYREPLSSTGTAGPTVCVDLRTGEEVWRRSDLPSISFALIRDLETPNFHGVYPAILCTSNFGQCFDAATGEPLFNVTGVPSGTTVLGPQGEHIRYAFISNSTTSQSPDYYLCAWNSTKMWRPATMQERSLDTTTTTTWGWVNTTTWVNGSKTITSENVTTSTTAVQANLGIRYENLSKTASQNVSLPWLDTMPGVTYSTRTRSWSSPVSIRAAFYNDMLLCMNGSYPSLGPGRSNPYTYFAVNLNASRGAIGSVLWWSNIDPPAGNITTVSFAGADAKAGYFCESYRQTQQFVGYSLKDGKQLWKGDSQPALDYYGSTGPGTLSNVVAYGHIYSSAMSGVLYCYDMATGKVLWTYGNGGPGNNTQSGFQVPGPYPTFINAIGNGIIYTVTTEHTFETPIYKGALVRAINATDGTEIYTLSAATGEFGAPSLAIADGYTTFFNSYDQQIYSVGRGPSKTAVTASPKIRAFGDSVMIEGTVMDISAGTKQTQQAADFPNGVPVASDASMKDWMGYVYQQKPLPRDFIGVPVTIDVLDSNNNYRNIGTATTDSSGFFSFMWKPDIPGNYIVIATFAGTNGYWPSYAESAFGVDEVLPTPSPEYPQPIDNTMTIVDVGVALLIAIAIVGAVIVLMLRKRA